MTSAEIEQIIEDTLATLPQRVLGNEANQAVAGRLRNLLDSDRSAIVECLRRFLSFRRGQRQRIETDAVEEARVWLALHIARVLDLRELRHDVENLVRDVRNGLVLSVAHEEMVSRYLVETAEI